MSDPVARVEVKIELWVMTAASWGPDCTIAQAQSQGKEAAVRLVERLLEGKPIKGDQQDISGIKVEACRVIIE